MGTHGIKSLVFGDVRDLRAEQQLKYIPVNRVIGNMQPAADRHTDLVSDADVQYLDFQAQRLLIIRYFCVGLPAANKHADITAVTRVLIISSGRIRISPAPCVPAGH